MILRFLCLYVEKSTSIIVVSRMSILCCGKLRCYPIRKSNYLVNHRISINTMPTDYQICKQDVCQHPKSVVSHRSKPTQETQRREIPFDYWIIWVSLLK